jgi:death-on-curing protein
MDPRWSALATVQAIHAEAVAAYGGSAEIRDPGLLESALDRPRNLLAYGDNPSVFDLAAAYCAGIVGNHPFIDGNKRAGLLAAVAFLDLNGYVLRPQEADAVLAIMALAAGEIDEAALAAWFAEYSEAR